MALAPWMADKSRFMPVKLTPAGIDALFVQNSILRKLKARWLTTKMHVVPEPESVRLREKTQET